MDRNERHFLQFYTPRKQRQKWKDKENRSEWVNDPLPAPVSVPCDPTTGKRAAGPVAACRGRHSHTHDHDNRHKNSAEDADQQSWFQSPPARSHTQNDEGVSNNVNNSCNYNDFMTPPAGSSKLLRNHYRSTVKQPHVKSTPGSYVPVATPPLGSIPRIAVGGSATKQRMLDSGAKRVRVYPHRRYDGADSTSPPWTGLTSALGTKRTMRFEGTSKVQSNVISRNQQIDDNHDQKILTETPFVLPFDLSPGDVTGSNKEIGKHGPSSTPCSNMGDENVANPTVPYLKTSNIPYSTGTKNDTPDSRGSLESCWESLPPCQIEDTTHRFDDDPTKVKSASESTSNSPSDFRWKCVMNPVASTLWNNALIRDVGHPCEVEDGATSAETTGGNQKDCDHSVESVESPVQLTAIVVDHQDRQHRQGNVHQHCLLNARRYVVGPWTHPFVYSPSHPTCGRIPQGIDSAGSSGVSPNLFPSPPKVSGNWGDLYGKGGFEPVNQSTKTCLRTPASNVVRPVAVYALPAAPAATSESSLLRHPSK